MNAENTVSEVFDSEFMKKLESLSFVTKKVFSSTSQGASPTTRAGLGVEFFDQRTYAAGDDFRYVDWNAFARLDELFLKLFHEEGDVCLYLLVDASASMGFGSPSKLVYAMRVAAALGYIALANLDRVSAVVLRGDRCAGLDLLKGKQQIFKIFRFLEGQRPEGRTSLHKALRAFGGESRHAGQVVLLSDLMDESGAVDGLKYLDYRGFEIQLIQVLSPEEMDPTVEEGSTVVDSETGEVVPVRSLAGYAAGRDAFLKALGEQCAEAGIPYLLANTATPFEDLVLRRLRLVAGAAS
jgi:uncharacterized protein (DUF58 family)